MKDASKANRGRPLEALVDSSNEHFRLLNLALIKKVPTDIKPIRNGKKMVGARIEKHSNAVDFLGNVQGRPIAFDTKHEAGKRISWGRVEDHQADYLTDNQRQKGLSFVLVGFSMERFFLVPWDFWNLARYAWINRPGIKFVYGNTSWTTPGMASAKADDFLPEWEVFKDECGVLQYLSAIK